jgi:phytoene dehydrogenase-like protein
VTLQDGEEIHADTVCATCDPKQTFLKLIAPRQLPVEVCDEVRVFRTRGTTAKVNLALSAPLIFQDRPGVAFEHIAIGETLDDLERAFDAVKYGEIPKNPHLEIHVPTIQDKSLAPDGHHVASVLFHFAPHDLAGGWNKKAGKALISTVKKRIARYAPGFEEQVVAATVTTPADLESDYGLTGGHVHHGEHALDQLLFMRPGPSVSAYATPVEGLFIGGSGSHPGGGITCAPGWLASKAILSA